MRVNWGRVVKEEDDDRGQFGNLKCSFKKLN